jgi:hypothetical protein
MLFKNWPMWIIRRIRSLYRHRFYPDGPWWFAHRSSCFTLIKALHECSDEEAAQFDRALEEARLIEWLEGY